MYETWDEFNKKPKEKLKKQTPVNERLNLVELLESRPNSKRMKPFVLDPERYEAMSNVDAWEYLNEEILK